MIFSRAHFLRLPSREGLRFCVLAAEQRLTSAAGSSICLRGSGSRRHSQQQLHQLANFRRARPLPPHAPKSLPQTLLLQGLPLLRVRCPPVRLIPRRLAPVHYLVECLRPGPPLHRGVTPQAPVEGAGVGPPVTQLLLAR